MKQNMSTKKITITAIIFIALLAILAYVYVATRPQATEGSKKIVVEVIIPGEDSEEFTIQTDAEFLRQALEEKDLVKGSESQYGLFITEVNGRAANSDKQEWWAITQDGEQLMYGVDQVAINDGDHYEITLTVGY